MELLYSSHRVYVIEGGKGEMVVLNCFCALLWEKESIRDLSNGIVQIACFYRKSCD